MSIQIWVNGEPCAFAGVTVAELLDSRNEVAPFAVAVNRVFVPKPSYAGYGLQEGDAVDIVRPVVGG